MLNIMMPTVTSIELHAAGFDMVGLSYGQCTRLDTTHSIDLQILHVHLIYRRSGLTMSWVNGLSIHLAPSRMQCRISSHSTS